MRKNASANDVVIHGNFAGVSRCKWICLLTSQKSFELGTGATGTISGGLISLKQENFKIRSLIIEQC